MSEATPKVITGLDVSDRYCSTCTITAAEGDVVEEGRLRTTPSALGAHFAGPRRRIALEVGPHSPWISRLLKELGHEVIVANARMVALIYSNPKKRDPVDAQSLARLGRVDPKLLYPIQHRSKEAQVDLSLIRSRDAVVRARVSLILHVRGSVKSFGSRIPSCSAEGFPAKAQEHLPDALRAGLEPVLETIRGLSRQIRFFDKRIEALCEERYPETGVLRQIKGVGPITALTYRLVIEDPARFPKSRAVGPYLGLTRRHDDSGESEPELRITKAGDAFLRRCLIQAGHYILGPFGPDTDLRRWGMEHIERGGNSKTAKKKAAVAVARKLAVLLHHLWSTGEVYEPLRQHEHASAAA